MRPKFSLIKNVKIGKGTIIRDHVNLYGCIIGNNCKIESFVYIEEGVRIGDDCKIKSHTFIPTGITIGNKVFVGPGVIFTNDMYPTVKNDFKLFKTKIEDNVSIGGGAVIVPGIKIGKGAMIGAGAVVTKNIPAGALAYGNPARVARKLK